MILSNAARFLLSPIIFFIIVSSFVPAQGREGLNGTDDKIPVVELIYCKGQSIIPVLLTTRQIDGYVGWQPELALAEESGIGKVVAYSQNFPPNGLWHNHPCCVLVASNDLLQNYPDTVVIMSALLMAGEEWAEENPGNQSEVVAQWLMGDRNYTLGDDTVSSERLFNRSLSTLVFSSEANLEWNASAKILIDDMGDILNTMQNTQHNGSENDLARFMDYGPHAKAAKRIGSKNSNYSIDLGFVKNEISIGYLMIDHQLPLFAAAMNWEDCEKKYGIALKPEGQAKRPRHLELRVQGKKAADAELISAPTGQDLMTMMEQGNLDMALVGITPAIGSISLGCKAKIIQPLQNEGSGLVLANEFGANDWDGFVRLAKASFAQGRPLRIGDPDLGTISDVIFQQALKESGLRAVRASGT
jgi:ABC-type nitrate/sulfonate/bicarbonate transport system substrate-binding protein